MRNRMIVLAVIVIAAMGGSQPALGGPNQSAANLAGTWNINVQPDPQSGLPPVVNVASLTKDGRVINVDPGVGTAVGEWQKQGDHTYAVTFTGFATLNGQSIRYKVRAELTLDEGGNQFSGPFLSEISDMNGNAIFSFQGVVVGTRMEVEPL